MMLALAACVPPETDYTSSEAVNELALSDASHHFVVRFVPGSDRLAAGEVQRLARLVADGDIGPSDRITVSPAGAPALAGHRSARIAYEMLRYGMTVGMVPVAAVPRDSAIVEVGRHLVTLPPCPNWSGPAAADFTNSKNSNFGCATVTNFGQMVANPTDLAGGQPLGMAAGGPAAAAVYRYKTDKVTIPPPNGSLPIAASQAAAPGGSNAPGS